MENILLNAGYDSTIVLSIITEKDIEIIENFVNSDFSVLNNSSYNSSKDNFCFKFKPGHKQLILNLPNLVNECIKNKKVLSVNEQNKKSFIHLSKDEDQLKQELVSKVSNYFEKRSLSVQLDAENIFEFHQNEKKFRCKFLCPLCDVKIGCEFITYWVISNLQNHIKSHLKKNNFETETVTIGDENLTVNSSVRENLLNKFLSE